MTEVMCCPRCPLYLRDSPGDTGLLLRWAGFVSRPLSSGERFLPASKKRWSVLLPERSAKHCGCRMRLRRFPWRELSPDQQSVMEATAYPRLRGLSTCGYLNPRALGNQVLKAGKKVSSNSTAPCAHKKGSSSRTSGPIGTRATLEVTNSRPPTGGVIMPSVRL